MSYKSERIAKMAKEITEIHEWRNTKLRKEKFFNWGSLVIFVALVGTITLATLYILNK